MTAKKVSVTVLSILGLVFILLLLTTDEVPVIQKEHIATSAEIPYPAEYNVRQGINDCGPFAAAAVVRAVHSHDVDSHAFAEEIGWRLPNRYTLPWGVEAQLRDHDVAITTPSVKNLSDDDKVQFLREQLSQEHPIILLGKQEYYQHYLTLFGFDAVTNTFSVYDPLFTKGDDGFTQDANGDLPGNRTLSTEELLTFWRGGGVAGVYQWYAIVASKGQE